MGRVRYRSALVLVVVAFLLGGASVAYASTYPADFMPYQTGAYIYRVTFPASPARYYKRAEAVRIWGETWVRSQGYRAATVSSGGSPGVSVPTAQAVRTAVAPTASVAQVVQGSVQARSAVGASGALTKLAKRPAAAVGVGMLAMTAVDYAGTKAIDAAIGTTHFFTETGTYMGTSPPLSSLFPALGGTAVYAYKSGGWFTQEEWDVALDWMMPGFDVEVDTGDYLFTPLVAYKPWDTDLASPYVNAEPFADPREFASSPPYPDPPVNTATTFQQWSNDAAWVDAQAASSAARETRPIVPLWLVANDGADSKIYFRGWRNRVNGQIWTYTSNGGLLAYWLRLSSTYAYYPFVKYLNGPAASATASRDWYESQMVSIDGSITPVVGIESSVHGVELGPAPFASTLPSLYRYNPATMEGVDPDTAPLDELVARVDVPASVPPAVTDAIADELGVDVGGTPGVDTPSLPADTGDGDVLGFVRSFWANQTAALSSFFRPSPGRLAEYIGPKIAALKYTAAHKWPFAVGSFVEQATPDDSTCTADDMAVTVDLTPPSLGGQPEHRVEVSYSPVGISDKVKQWRWLWLAALAISWLVLIVSYLRPSVNV